jgi:hypothetical protein
LHAICCNTAHALLAHGAQPQKRVTPPLLLLLLLPLLLLLVSPCIVCRDCACRHKHASPQHQTHADANQVKRTLQNRRIQLF